MFNHGRAKYFQEKIFIGLAFKPKLPRPLFAFLARAHRNQHRSIFRIGIYSDPFGWGYQSWGIGSYLYPSYYSQSYWLDDPWQYRLPPAYGPPVQSVASVPRTDKLKYGAYLAGPVAHCLECHSTPGPPWQLVQPRAMKAFAPACTLVGASKPDGGCCVA